MIKRGREDEDKKENETQHHRGESQRILLAACARACARVHTHTYRVDAGCFSPRIVRIVRYVWQLSGRKLVLLLIFLIRET